MEKSKLSISLEREIKTHWGVAIVFDCTNTVDLSILQIGNARWKYSGRGV